MPENIKLRVSVDGGPTQQGPVDGGIQVANGAVIQLSLASTSGVSFAKYRISSFPDGFPCPSGWTEEANMYVCARANGAPPPSFTAPADPLFGSLLLDVEVNNRRRNGMVAEDLFDGTLGIWIPSPSGARAIAYLETLQFDQKRSWVGALQALIALLENAGLLSLVALGLVPGNVNFLAVGGEGASDSNPGTPEAPLATIDEALRRNPIFGITLMVAGTYSVVDDNLLRAPRSTGLSISAHPDALSTVPGVSAITASSDGGRVLECLSGATPNAYKGYIAEADNGQKRIVISNDADSVTLDSPSGATTSNTVKLYTGPIINLPATVWGGTSRRATLEIRDILLACSSSVLQLYGAIHLNPAQIEGDTVTVRFQDCELGELGFGGPTKPSRIGVLAGAASRVQFIRCDGAICGRFDEAWVASCRSGVPEAEPANFTIESGAFSTLTLHGSTVVEGEELVISGDLVLDRFSDFYPAAEAVISGPYSGVYPEP
jgi:hypothetical protein